MLDLVKTVLLWYFIACFAMGVAFAIGENAPY